MYSRDLNRIKKINRETVEPQEGNQEKNKIVGSTFLKLNEKRSSCDTVVVWTYLATFTGETGEIVPDNGPSFRYLILMIDRV